MTENCFSRSSTDRFSLCNSCWPCLVLVFAGMTLGMIFTISGFAFAAALSRSRVMALLESHRRLALQGGSRA